MSDPAEPFTSLPTDFQTVRLTEDMSGCQITPCRNFVAVGCAFALSERALETSSPIFKIFTEGFAANWSVFDIFLAKNRTKIKFGLNFAF